MDIALAVGNFLVAALAALLIGFMAGDGSLDQPSLFTLLFVGLVAVATIVRLMVL